MATKTLVGLAVSALVGAAVVTSLSQPAQADPLPYGPDTCISGYVWREARPGDTVCVTPAVRDQVAQQNAHPSSNKDPLAGSGPESCSQGYVWREAFDGDTICVTPAVRSATLADNAAAASRKAANAPIATPAPKPQAGRVVFEITGSGTVYSINTDPDGRGAGENTAVPWSQTMTIGPDVQLLQVISVAKTGNQGCRITLNGTVVVDHAPGTSSHCVFNVP